MLLWRRADARKKNLQRRTTPQFALHANMSAACPNNVVHDRETQSRAFLLTLGGEEGLKNSALGLGIHSDAAVGDRQHNILASRQSRRTAVRGRICGDVSGLQ